MAPAGTVFSVSATEKPEYGDYSTNIALILEKKEGRNPKETAEEIKKKLLGNPIAKRLEKIEIAGPGFLNFYISKESLIGGLREVLKKQKKWGDRPVGIGKKIIVEYFQLNVGKPSHVGHLRSAVIGDALKRILKTQGYKTISDTHIGDWGTQFGILIQAFKRNEISLTKQLPRTSKSYAITADPTIKLLERLYVEENERIEKEPILREKAKEEFAKLENGDSENRVIWEWLKVGTENEIQRIINRFDLLQFEEERGESEYNDMMPLIVKEALEKGIAINKDGAIIVDLISYNLDEAILIKTDGASTYLLRDLATIKYRKKEWDFYKNLYVVDVRQEHHFKQVFKVAELLGFEGVGESDHISYGFMSLPEGTISTRKGTVISLDAVLDESEKRALQIIEEKNPELENKEEIAKQVGLGALKYFDLSHNRHSDIVFKWDEALSFAGNSGPYLQYTYARLKSILRKLEGKSGFMVEDVELDQVEKNLIASVLCFPEVIEDALNDFMPNILANYLNQLAQLANNFYHSHPVTQENNVSKKMFRVNLINGVALTLSKGLSLLGISSPEKM